MKRTLSFPVKQIGADEWLDLTAHGLSHDFVGERVNQRQDMSFAGGHRVRCYVFKKNVHWKLPAQGVVVDIADVAPVDAQQREPSRRGQGRGR